MDWSKVDANLAGALAEGASGDRYVVFVHMIPSAEAAAAPDLPCTTNPDGRVRTATVSAQDVDRLSERADVSQIRLSRTLGLSDPA